MEFDEGKLVYMLENLIDTEKKIKGTFFSPIIGAVECAAFLANYRPSADRVTEIWKDQYYSSTSAPKSLDRHG